MQVPGHGCDWLTHAGAAVQEPAGKLEDGLMVNPDAIEEAMAQALGRLEPASEVSC